MNVLRYIEEEDLLRFLKTVEVHTIFPLFEGAVETGKITKSSFRNWVVSETLNPLFYFLDFVLNKAPHLTTLDPYKQAIKKKSIWLGTWESTYI